MDMPESTQTPGKKLKRYKGGKHSTSLCSLDFPHHENVITYFFNY